MKSTLIYQSTQRLKQVRASELPQAQLQRRTQTQLLNPHTTSLENCWALMQKYVKIKEFRQLPFA